MSVEHQRCRRGIQQLSGTCVFMSTVNAFLLSNGLYSLALKYLNDFIKELKDNEELKNEFLNISTVCLSDKMIEMLSMSEEDIYNYMINNDLILFNYENALEKYLKDYTKYIMISKKKILY